MKMRMVCAVLMLTALTCGSAWGWGMPSIPSKGSSSAGDPDAFLAKAKVSEELVNKSANLLFALVASKEAQAKAEELQKQIDATTDAKEKSALMAKKVSSNFAELGQAAGSEKLKAEIKSWSAQKRDQAVNAMFNLALGGKIASDLVPQGQSLASSVKSNPMLLMKVKSLTEAVSSLQGIGTGTYKVLTALPPVFSAANIEVKLPTSSSDTPKPIDM